MNTLCLLKCSSQIAFHKRCDDFNWEANFMGDWIKESQWKLNILQNVYDPAVHNPQKGEMRGTCDQRNKDILERFVFNRAWSSLAL